MTAAFWRRWYGRRRRRELRREIRDGSGSVAFLAEELAAEHDPAAGAIERAALAGLTEPGALDEALAVLVETASTALAEALAAAPLLPADPGRRALLLLLADDARYDPTDTDHAQRVAALGGAAMHARVRVAARARTLGRPEWIRAAVGPRPAPRADDPSAEWDARIAAHVDAGRQDDLRRWVSVAPPVHGARMLRALDEGGWRPRSEAERRLRVLAGRCSPEPPAGLTYAERPAGVVTEPDAGEWAVLSPDGRFLVVSDESVLRLRRAADGGLLGTLDVWDAPLPGEIAVGADGRLLVCPVGNGDGSDIGVWDVASCSLRTVLAAPPGDRSLLITPDGARLVCVGTGDRARSRPELTIFTLPEGRHERTVRIRCREPHSLTCSGDGTVLAASCRRGVHRWALPSATALRGFTEGGAILWMSPDGESLLHRNGAIARLRRPSGGRVLVEMPVSGYYSGPPEYRERQVVTPDGEMLIEVSMLHTIHAGVRRLRLSSGSSTDRLPDDPGTVESLALTPDGRVLAGLSDDGSVHLWSPSSGTPLGVLRRGAHPPSTTVVAARDALVGCRLGELLVWPALLPRLARTPLSAVRPADVAPLRRAPTELSTDDERAWTDLLVELAIWAHRHDVEVSGPDPSAPGRADIEIDPASDAER